MRAFVSQRPPPISRNSTGRSEFTGIILQEREPGSDHEGNSNRWIGRRLGGTVTDIIESSRILPLPRNDGVTPGSGRRESTPPVVGGPVVKWWSKRRRTRRKFNPVLFISPRPTTTCLWNGIIRCLLSVDEPVNFSRPSIDVLFQSAAEAYGPALLGIVLTGASHDGSRGLFTIKKFGGIAVVQDPSTAQASLMPSAAIQATGINYILKLEDIGPFLTRLESMEKGRDTHGEK